VTKSKLILILFAITLFVPSLMAQDDYLTLFVKKSPNYGGVVTSRTGIKSGGVRLVNISATPRQGYQFVHWLGDVSDPSNSSTTIILETPKVVIAVFEREQLKIPSSSITGSAGSGYGSSSSSYAASSRRYSSGTGYSISPASSRGYKIIPPVRIPNYPGPAITPEAETEVTPEPATVLLLSTGVLLIARKKRRQPDSS